MKTTGVFYIYQIKKKNTITGISLKKYSNFFASNKCAGWKKHEQYHSISGGKYTMYLTKDKKIML